MLIGHANLLSSFILLQERFAYILHLSLSKCFTLISLNSRGGKGCFSVPFIAPSYKWTALRGVGWK